MLKTHEYWISLYILTLTTLIYVCLSRIISLPAQLETHIFYAEGVFFNYGGIRSHLNFPTPIINSGNTWIKHPYNLLSGYVYD